MTRILEALLLAAILLAVALLAVFDIVPAAVAQYAPLAALPFLLRHRGCAPLAKAGR